MRGGQVNKKIPKSQDNFQELDNPFEWVFQTNRGKELPQINWLFGISRGTAQIWGIQLVKRMRRK